MFTQKLKFNGRGIKYNFDAILQNNTVAWYDYTDLTTLTLTDASVSRWNDKLGSGHDLIQATGSKQPSWSSNGILFDGISDSMKTNIFDLNQPELIYIVFNQKSWTNGDVIFDGNTVSSGNLSQLTTSSGLKAGASTYSAQNSGLLIDIFGIVRVLFNVASSKLQVNNATPVYWSCGTNNMGAFTLSSNVNQNGAFSNIQVKEIIIRNIVDTAGDEWKIYNYLKYKHNLNI